MNRNAPKGWHSRGYLPHFDSLERIQHVVFRTTGSLPKALFENTATDVDRIDAVLDRGEGPLADPAAARIIEDAIRHFDGERFRLFAWAVMPNHVHVVLEPLGVSTGAIIRGWKAFSASRINKAKGARGAFWARDYFDRYMRDEDDLSRTIVYVERNPVAAGLAASPEDWPWSSARLRREEERAFLQARMRDVALGSGDKCFCGEFRHDTFAPCGASRFRSSRLRVNLSASHALDMVRARPWKLVSVQSPIASGPTSMS